MSEEDAVYGVVCGESRGKADHFNCVMFAEKRKQLKDGKCDGCDLDSHTGDETSDSESANGEGY